MIKQGATELGTVRLVDELRTKLAAAEARAEATEADNVRLRRALDAAFGELTEDEPPAAGEVVQLIVLGRLLPSGIYQVGRGDLLYPPLLPAHLVRFWRPVWAGCRNAAEQRENAILFPDADGATALGEEAIP